MGDVIQGPWPAKSEQPQIPVPYGQFMPVGACTYCPEHRPAFHTDDEGDPLCDECTDWTVTNG